MASNIPQNSDLKLVSQQPGAICLCGRDGQSEWRFVSSGQRFGTRRPTPSSKSFPPEFREFSYSPSPDGTDSNLLIMMHGLGDSHKPFAALAKTFGFPQTACLSIRAPFPLPLDLGHGWFDAIDIGAGGDYMKHGDVRRTSSLAKCLDLLDQLLEALISVGEWQPSEIFLFGFSQGGTVALEWALRRSTSWKPDSEKNKGSDDGHDGSGESGIGGTYYAGGEISSEAAVFGGVVAVAAGLMEERRGEVVTWPPKHPPVMTSSLGSARMCECLLIAGKRDTTCPPTWIKKSAALVNIAASAAYQESTSASSATSISSKVATTVSFFNKGHAMIESPAEGRVMMEWFATRLKKVGAWENDPTILRVQR